MADNKSRTAGGGKGSAAVTKKTEAPLSKAAKNAMKRGASPEKAAKVAAKFEANKKGGK